MHNWLWLANLCFDQGITVRGHLDDLRNEYEKRTFTLDENGNNQSYEKCQDLVSATANYIFGLEAILEDSCVHEKGNEENKKKVLKLIDDLDR
jgi:hypothetical protein